MYIYIYIYIYIHIYIRREKEREKGIFHSPSLHEKFHYIWSDFKNEHHLLVLRNFNKH